ncbi:hypothetical protein L596_016763 [Steinernema carpocapsae]|uniref:Uncharacterized protein n=1 Tax=Steinernema carpocapsae TaxID=34508 RepID=A0A4U5NKD9_STECR|nr:hypothetical protein L596_016763 [Steinernema carpocapsae]
MIPTCSVVSAQKGSADSALESSELFLKESSPFLKRGREHESLSLLSYDIIYDFFDLLPFDEKGLPPGCLSFTQITGTWNELYIPKLKNANLDTYIWLSNERDALRCKAPNARGSLYLKNLHKWGNSKKVAPTFEAKNVRWAAEHLKDFLRQQLTSPFLKVLECEVEEDLGIDDELVQFTASDQIESLHWSSALSVSTLIQTYKNWQNREIGQFHQRRLLSVSVAKSEVSELQRELNLHKNANWNTSYFWKRDFNVSDPTYTVEMHLVGNCGYNEVDQFLYIFFDNRDDVELLTTLEYGRNRCCTRVENGNGGTVYDNIDELLKRYIERF